MYPTTAELVAASTVSELTDLEEAQQDALRQEAIDAIEGVCRQSFLQEGTEGEPVERIIDGPGSRELYLPKRLIELTKLATSGSALTASDVVLSEAGDRLHVPSERDGGTWATRAIAEATGRVDPIFPHGPGSVTVTGVWGWAEVPSAIVTALRLDMEDRALATGHALAESVRSTRALGVSGIDQGGLSVQLRNREPGVSARVRRVLRTGNDGAGYIWHRWGGGVV